jgi:leucyl/phenylalanyl-tRNA--protein transferase
MILDADTLLDCYRRGVFPMGEARDDPRVMIVEPRLRGVIDPGRFHLSRRLARTVRADAFEVSVDRDFDGVVAACAASAPDREDTWINRPIRLLYSELHARGAAHSVECRRDGVLVGGLYGVSIGGAFFGESMFSNARDASKVALVHLVARLLAGAYTLLDCQFQTEHLEQFGTEEIPQADYLEQLERALALSGDFGALGPGVSGYAALQAISQAS